MVEGQLCDGKSVAAVLTRVAVPCVDVRAGKRYIVKPLPDGDVAQQPDHGRQLERQRHGPHLGVVDRDDLDLALTPERDRLSPVDDLQRLVGRVEE